MSIQTQFFDHRHIYINGKIFYPVIHRKDNITSDTNTVIIELDGNIHSFLDWQVQINEAKEYVEKGFYILWEIDLGLCEKNFLIEDEMYFQSAKMALTHFGKVIWEHFRSFTLAVSLYRGKIPQFSHQEKDFSSLFQMNLLSEYLHLLAPYLPDDVIMMAMLDLSEISSKSELVHLTSKNLFEFFLLAIKGKEVSTCLGIEKYFPMGGINVQEHVLFEKKVSNVGICFTSDPIHKDYDEIFISLDQHNVSYRVIPERFLSEQWDEIDYMIITGKQLTFQTKRMLQGFCAAGGTLVYVSGSVGIDPEISYKEFLENRGRGI